MTNSGLNKNAEDCWDEKAVEEGAKRNRASWRQDCVKICASDDYSPVIHDIAARLIRLVDETECMYNGGPLKLKEICELMNTLDELRSKLRW